MRGSEMVLLTEALDSDNHRLSLLTGHGFNRTDAFGVLYSRSLKDLITVPKLDPPLCLRYATDDDMDARVDVHSDAWAAWGHSSVTVETDRRLRIMLFYDPEVVVGIEDASAKILGHGHVS